MANEIIYRLANDKDINEINIFYNTIYKKNRTYEQFWWEYNSSPAGKALYTIAEYDGKVVGTQCAIPFYVINHNNEEVLSAKLEDVLVSPEHRGKNIFENMYKFSIQECKKNNIDFIWGFAYIIKHYTKIGFEIPYRNTMGILTLKPIKAANYYFSITAKKNIISYSKILALSYVSYFKYNIMRFNKIQKLNLDTNSLVELNNKTTNYIQHPNLFGLKLDTKFIDYRITNNPYSKNYKTISWFNNNKLKASLIYNVTKNNVGFIINMYFDMETTSIECSQFIKNVILYTNLKQCSVVRFWGFTHNAQNSKEVNLLKQNNFIFLNRGISFVGLNLNTEKPINFSNFVLSRMASQGTD